MHNHFSAPTLLAADLDGAAMQLHQLFDQGQPDAGTFKIAGAVGFGLVKAVENVGQLVSGNADAGVFDADLDKVGSCSCSSSLSLFLTDTANCYCHVNLPTLRGKFDGIGKQIVEDLFNFFLIKIKFKRFDFAMKLQIDFLFFSHGLKSRGNSSQRRDDVLQGRLQLHFSGFEFGEVQQLIDELQQVLSMPAHHPKALFAVNAFHHLE